MLRIDASYDHVVVNPRDMSNFLEGFEIKLKEILTSLRPKNSDCKIYIDPRAQSPISRNLPSIDVKFYCDGEWALSDLEQQILVEQISSFLTEARVRMNLKEGNLLVRMYPRENPVRIST
jgi:inhibitor of KinA sporulation pathway (predicted exonuclease)